MHAQREFHIPKDQPTAIPQTSKALSQTTSIPQTPANQSCCKAGAFFQRGDGWVSSCPVPL